ncbi:MAG: WbqC family protein [Elusimicrobia bacterium]|nr:WbqC family protein [Elusimicrobiota bacterium]
MMCVIMQPTYFPWPGYFNLIASADVFVFLDDVAYEKTSWQNRNRVLVSGRPHWITVPARRMFLGQQLRNVEVSENNRWRDKHFRLLKESYARHPHYTDMMDIVSILRDESLKSLVDLNTKIIRTVCDRLGLLASFRSSGQMGILGDRSERLSKICVALGCDTYLSPIGAKEYLENDHFSSTGSVRLLFQDYSPQSYPQMGSKNFFDHLSILDLIANVGFSHAAAYVKSGGS